MKHSIPRNNKDAVCYYRVSTKKQHDKGNSISSQKDYAKKYSDKNNLKIIEEFAETKSASKIQIENFDYSRNLYESLDSRPRLKEIMKLAMMKRFKHLIVFSRDRLARNFELFVALRFFFDRFGIQIHYAKPGEDMLSKNERLGKFFELILSSIAELESNLISTRVKSGLKQSIKNKNWVSYRPPYGYIEKASGSKGKKLVLSIPESRNVEKVFNLYNNYGYSYEKIANILKEKSPDCDWSKAKVERIIKNEIYKGYIFWNRRSKTTDKELVISPLIDDIKIIDDSDWETSKKLRYKKNKLKDTKYYSTPFLLKDKLICGHCNKKMKPKSYGPDKNGNKRPRVYRCTTKNGNRSHFIEKQDIMESTFIEAFSNICTTNIITNITNQLYQRYCQEILDRKIKLEKQIKVLNNDIEDIKCKLEKLNNVYSMEMKKHNKDDTIIKILLDNKSKIASRYSTLKEELSQLKSKKNEIDKHINRINNQENIEAIKSHLKKSLKKFIHVDFPKLDNPQKRMIIDMVIEAVIVTKDSFTGDNIKSMEIIFKAPFDNYKQFP